MDKLGPAFFICMLFGGCLAGLEDGSPTPLLVVIGVLLYLSNRLK